MNEIVIVPSYKREELLWLCLEAIRREDANIRIVVFSDRGAGSGELSECVLNWVARLIIRPNHAHYGNSYNLLEACRWATRELEEEFPPQIIHLIEDDTIIHKGYFAWAREKLRFAPFPGYGPVYAAVCGRMGSSHISNWYESPCASWNADCLRQALTHVIPEYFGRTREEMQTVLDTKMFPNSRYKRGGAEQDGFFLRCIEAHGWKTLFPPKPLASHVGWWGYNCPPLRKGPAGTFEERIAACRMMLKNRDERIKLFGYDVTLKEMEAMR